MKSNEYDIRAAIVSKLIADGILRENIRIEIPLDTASSNGRADIVILGNDLRCIELKSGKDKFNNKDIEDQIQPYIRIFDYVGIAVDESHKRIMEYDAGCGHKGYRDNWSIVTLSYNHATGIVTEGWRGGYGWQRRGLAACDMLRVLWAKEVGDIIGRATANKWKYIEKWYEDKPIKEIRQMVINALRKRPLNKWEEKFWKQFDSQVSL